MISLNWVHHKSLWSREKTRERNSSEQFLALIGRGRSRRLRSRAAGVGHSASASGAAGAPPPPLAARRRLAVRRARRPAPRPAGPSSADASDPPKATWWRSTDRSGPSAATARRSFRVGRRPAAPAPTSAPMTRRRPTIRSRPRLSYRRPGWWWRTAGASASPLDRRRRPDRPGGGADDAFFPPVGRRCTAEAPVAATAPGRPPAPSLDPTKNRTQSMIFFTLKLGFPVAVT